MMKYQKVCVLLPSFIVLAKFLDLHYLIRKQTGVAAIRFQKIISPEAASGYT